MNNDKQGITLFDGGFAINNRELISQQYKSVKSRSDLFRLPSPYISSSSLIDSKTEISAPPKKKRKIKPLNERSREEILAIEHHVNIREELQKSHESYKKIFVKEESSDLQEIYDEKEELQKKYLAEYVELMSGISNLPQPRTFEIPQSLKEIEDSNLFGNFIRNTSDNELKINFLGASYLVPPKSGFMMSDFKDISTLVSFKPPKGYNLIVMDPPWENKSVQRGNKYKTLSHTELKKLPIPELVSEDGCIVAVWTTNKEIFHKYIIDELFPLWKVKYISTWNWMKVTNSGELVVPLDCVQRRPYEPLILGYVGNCSEEMQKKLASKTIFAIPSKHSRKPMIRECFANLFDNINTLELFARNLCCGVDSWGNERNFFDKIKSEWGVVKPEDWARLSAKQIAKSNGGSTIMKAFNSGLFDALSTAYPEVNWKLEWFSRNPRGFWKDKKNQKNFLDQFAKNLNIKLPSDWGRITTYQLKISGGGQLLNEYNGSLRKALASLYPDTEWKMEWFPIYPKRYWHSKENRKKFFEQFAKENGIKELKDWKKVTNQHIIDGGGSSLLRLYNGSLRNALKSAFDNISWKKNYFHAAPRNYWKDKKNQRNFYLHLENQFQIKEPREWSKITIKRINNEGGFSWLQYNSFSILQALRSSSPEIDWNPYWFKKNRYFWQDRQNQRNFLDNIAKVYGLNKITDWSRITTSLIIREGGKGMLSLHRNSLLRALQATYPEKEFFKNPNRISVSHQNLLKAIVTV